MMSIQMQIKRAEKMLWKLIMNIFQQKCINQSFIPYPNVQVIVDTNNHSVQYLNLSLLRGLE